MGNGAASCGSCNCRNGLRIATATIVRFRLPPSAFSSGFLDGLLDRLVSSRFDYRSVALMERSQACCRSGIVVVALACGVLLAVSLGCGRRADDGKDARQQSDPRRRLRHDGQRRPGLGRTVPSEAPGRQRPGARRRLGRGHRQPDRRQLRPGQHQPQDEAETRSSGARANRGGEPKEIIVGYDALAIYVHKDNPLDSISMEELAEIYGEDGKITKWSQLGRDRRQARRRQRSRASAGRAVPAPTPISARSCWARARTSSSARSTRAARRTWWPWSRARPRPSATAAWATPRRR